MSANRFISKIITKHNNHRLNNLLIKRYYSTYKEAISNTDESGYKTVPHYNEKSALFTKINSVFPRLINPELNLESIFKLKDINKSGLMVNLNARHNQLDLQRLKEDYFKMIELEKKIQNFNLEKDKISNQVNNLVKSKIPKNKLSETDEFKKLISSGNEIKAQISLVNEKLIPLSEIVKIACLRLPNSLHASSLISYLDNNNNNNNNKTSNMLLDLNLNVIFSCNDDYRLYKKCSINWRHIFKKNTEWSFVENSSTFDSLNIKYYVGEYARLENAIINYVQDKIESLNELKSSSLTSPLFEHIKSSSVFKTAVIEGCGQNINDQREIINIIEFGNTGNANIDLFHLTGSCSLNALVLDFIRTKIKKSYLPWTVYSSGRNYSPQKGQVNRFDFLSICSDSSQYLMLNNSNDDCKVEVHLKGEKYIDMIKNELNNNHEHLFEENQNKIDNLFIDHLKLFVYIFKEFNLPIRFRLLSANQLTTSESLKVTVESYLPSEHKFLNIGEVCLLNDYLSERLQIRLDDANKKQLKHVSMVYTNLIDINLFMQILIESNINSNFEFIIPNVLKKYF